MFVRYNHCVDHHQASFNSTVWRSSLTSKLRLTFGLLKCDKLVEMLDLTKKSLKNRGLKIRLLIAGYRIKQALRLKTRLVQRVEVIKLKPED